MNLLAPAIEQRYKKPFHDQTKENIINKIGLTTLQPDFHSEEIYDINGTQLYRTKGFKNKYESRGTDVSYKLGGGGYMSNIIDFTKWCLSLCKMSYNQQSKELNINKNIFNKYYNNINKISGFYENKNHYTHAGSDSENTLTLINVGSHFGFVIQLNDNDNSNNLREKITKIINDKLNQIQFDLN